MADPVAAERILKGMSARVVGATNGRAESLRRRRAAADERDRAAFYETWWDKRGKHLAAGREPKIAKERLAGDIAATLPEGKRGSSETSVRRAVDRWEAPLLAKRTGRVATSLALGKPVRSTY
jgi:hypothetical protein